MPRYRHNLPQLSDKLFLSAGGLETTLVFIDQVDLPHFASFVMIDRPGGVDYLRRFYQAFIDIAKSAGAGMMLDSATWRASRDWGKLLGYDDARLYDVNQRFIKLLAQIRDENQTDKMPMVISGVIGPRGDGYVPARAMTALQAAEYHSPQVKAFADEPNCDMIFGATLSQADEAIGMVLASKSHNMPVTISFTLETDGCLPTGQPLGEAISAVDQATDGHASYFMVNCAHPTHFENQLDHTAPWAHRLRGVRANASSKSHAELNESPQLDDGNPVEFAQQCLALKKRMPGLNMLGGCCGTDIRHLKQVALTCAPAFGLGR